MASVEDARRRRILVALEPAVLEGAVAVLLNDEDKNEIVQFHAANANDLVGRYDAAVVTAALLDEVDADVVITLPQARSGVEVSHSSRSFQHVVGLLDELRAIEVTDH